MENEGVKLELILKANGDVTLNGPLGNKMICFYILELAREALHNYKPTTIAPVTGINPDILKHAGNGRA